MKQKKLTLKKRTITNLEAGSPFANLPQGQMKDLKGKGWYISNWYTDVMYDCGGYTMGCSEYCVTYNCTDPGICDTDLQCH